MLFTGAHIFLGEKGFVPGNLAVSGDRIREILTEGRQEEESEDLGGAYVIPGLVDIHTHGNSGADFSDGSAEGLRRMGQYLAQRKNT